MVTLKTSLEPFRKLILPMKFDLSAIVIAVISAIALTAAAFITGLFNKKKTETEAEANQITGLLEQLKFYREDLASAKSEIATKDAKEKVLNEMLDRERKSCQKQIDELRAQMEKMQQTISMLRTELGLGPGH